MGANQGGCSRWKCSPIVPHVFHLHVTLVGVDSVKQGFGCHPLHRQPSLQGITIALAPSSITTLSADLFFSPILPLHADPHPHHLPARLNPFLIKSH